MDEKQHSTDEMMDDEQHSTDQNQLPRPRRQPRRWVTYLQWLVVAYMLVVLFRLVQESCTPKSERDQPNGGRTYDGERIEWTSCPDADGFECSAIDVPMDHFNSTNSGDKTFSIPLIRLRGETATRNMLVNPGGPGGSGIELVQLAGRRLKAIVGEDLHIVGFDPRGVNASRPAALCYPDRETRARRASPPEPDAVRHSPALYAWTDNFVRACADATGEHGRYVNTPQTAADMNAILDALGQEGMVYWGTSYGSLLGQTYATMFPERAERVVIDGVVNHHEYYESPVARTQFADSENALAGFFDECVKAGDACALSSLAGDGEALRRRVMAFVEGLRRDPFNVYVNSTVHGTLDHATMLYALFRGLHTPAGWYELADNLARLMRGNGTAALWAYGLRDDFDPAMRDHNLIIHTNDGRSGPEHWPQKEELVELLLPHLNESVFAPMRWPEYYKMAQWRIPRTHAFEPRRRVETRRPLLILSQTYDPITPLASARVARRAFKDSRLVRVKGIGHCSPAIHSACLAKHVRAFLLDGTLPDADVECEVDAPYFIKPEDKARIAARGAEKHASDEDRLWAAQLGLSDALRMVHRAWDAHGDGIMGKRDAL